MVLDRLRPLCLIRIAERPLAIDHDQVMDHAVILRPLVEVLEVGHVLGLVLEEGVDELDRADAEILPGNLREVEVVDLLLEERLVERPLGERDLKGRLRRGDDRLGPGKGDPRRGQRRLLQKLTTIGHVLIPLSVDLMIDFSPSGLCRPSMTSSRIGEVVGAVREPPLLITGAW